MTVQQLIKILQKVEDKTLPVVLYCDHGQYAMKLTTYGEQFVEKLATYMMETIHEDDLEAYPKAVKVYELGAP